MLRRANCATATGQLATVRLQVCTTASWTRRHRFSAENKYGSSTRRIVKIKNFWTQCGEGRLGGLQRNRIRFGSCLSAWTRYKCDCHRCRLQTLQMQQQTNRRRRYARGTIAPAHCAGSALTQRATTAPELAPTHPTCQVHMNEKREAPRDGSGDTNCASLKMNAKLGPAMPVCDTRQPPHDSLR